MKKLYIRKFTMCYIWYISCTANYKARNKLLIKVAKEFFNFSFMQKRFSFIEIIKKKVCK